MIILRYLQPWPANSAVAVKPELYLNFDPKSLIEIYAAQEPDEIAEAIALERWNAPIHEAVIFATLDELSDFLDTRHQLERDYLIQLWNLQSLLFKKGLF